MNKTTLIGIDLAKNVFHLHAVNASGQKVWRKKLTRSQLQEFLACQEPVIVAMEACASSHYWGRVCQEHGHKVRLMAPQFVKPFVKSNKNDRNDAMAICEAALRPDMRFVPVKSISQQTVLSLHRMREMLIGQRTRLINQLRGLLSEFGYVIGVGRVALDLEYPRVMEALEQSVSAAMVAPLRALWALLQQIDEHIDQVTEQVVTHARTCEQAKRLQTIPGIGPIIASALSAAVGDAAQFKSGRQMAAWLGLVPRQHSTGGKPRLLGISKRGDSYLRKLLIHGARSIASHCKSRGPQYASRHGMLQLIAQKHCNVAVVALANRNVRIAWAVMKHQRDYDESIRKQLALQLSAA